MEEEAHSDGNNTQQYSESDEDDDPIASIGEGPIEMTEEAAAELDAADRYEESDGVVDEGSSTRRLAESLST